MRLASMRLAPLLLAMLALVPLALRAEPEAVEPAAAQLNPLADGRLGALTALRERPLFAPTRRAPLPPPPPAAPMVEETAAAPPAPPPALRLIGIVEADGTRFALLSRSGGPTQTLRVGDTLESWTVSAIEPQSLMLRAGAREQSYPIFAPNPVATVAPAANGDPL